MASTCRRLRDPSTARLMCSGRLFRPTHCGPPLGSSSKPNLVAITTLPLNGASASPTSSSALFHNGDVGHGRGRCGAVPMLFAGRKPDHIAWPNFFPLAAPSLRPPAPRCDDQSLTEWMRMPCGAGARLERDVAAKNPCRFGRLEQRVHADRAGEVVRWSLAGRL